jgi:hypothetical protein
MISNVIGALLQALEIIFEMKMERSNENSKKRNRFSNLENTIFFFFLDPSYFQTSQLSYFLFIFKQFKML